MRAVIAQGLVVRERGRVRLLRPADVAWVDAARNAVRLHVGDAVVRLACPIGVLAKRLDPHRFIRIHRSTLVNLDAVAEFRVDARGDYAAVMAGGIRLAVGRKHRAALLALWSH